MFHNKTLSIKRADKDNLMNSPLLTKHYPIPAESPIFERRPPTPEEASSLLKSLESWKLRGNGLFTEDGRINADRTSAFVAGGQDDKPDLAEGIQDNTIRLQYNLDGLMWLLHFFFAEDWKTPDELHDRIIDHLKTISS